MTQVDLDELRRLDPDLAARVQGRLVVAAMRDEDDPDEDDPDGLGEDQVDAERIRAETLAQQDPEQARRARKEAKRAARRAAADAGDTGTWDDFWAQIERQEADERGEAAYEVIRGVRVKIPHDLPLKFDRRATELERSGRIEDVHELVTLLFGEDVLDAWTEAGMRDTEFRTVLLWGIGHGKGRPISFEQAYEAVRTEGKSLLPSRSARRASAPSGGPSRPTSTASTGSPRARSRR